MKVKLIVSVFISILLFACNNGIDTQETKLKMLADSIGQKYAPDKRDDVYEITVTTQNGAPLLSGFTTLATAKEELLKQAKSIAPSCTDSIILLPDPTIGDSIYGIINISVADAHVQNKYSSEMGTQLLLGMPVQILQRDSWWRIKSPEGYIAWITDNSMVRMNKKQFNEWTAAPKVIFTDIYGFAYESPDKTKQTVSDLVFGNILKYDSDAGEFYKVKYPDGKTAYILKSQSQQYNLWLDKITVTGKSIVEKALTLKGIPYTWGGTSVKMMDCSGFTKTVMLMHGIILLRDASQQVATGIPVDISQGYENLQPGDLMFFGKKSTNEKKERIRHVGFYIGNQEFIHAGGYVKISSLNPEKNNYDELNTKEFIRASRIIGAEGTKGIWNIDQHPMYKEQE